MCLFPKVVRVHPNNDFSFNQKVSCGHCLECLQKKSTEWSFRIMDEVKCHSDSCFLTLTYNDENLPLDKSVSRREVQLFMKRLRKWIAPTKVRFFACGEYGKKKLRPHYHFILFGWKPSDLYIFDYDDGIPLYRSPSFEKSTCWIKGFSSFGDVTLKTAKYCAKYMQKWQFDKAHKKSDLVLTSPFVQMSNRPGIGYDMIYSRDYSDGRLYNSGKSITVPRYYLKVMERDGIAVDLIKEKVQCNGKAIEALTDLEAKRERYWQIFQRSFIRSNLNSSHYI